MMICKEIIFSEHSGFKVKTKMQRRKGEAKRLKKINRALWLGLSINEWIKNVFKNNQ